MEYLTNYYKNLSEQLQNKVNMLSSQIKFLNESANPDPGDLQSPWQTPYSNPYSPSQPYWTPPEPKPTRQPGRGIIPSIDDVYPPESPTKRRGRPIPELGVVNDEREKSVEEWMLDMLPKEIREAMKQFLRNYNQEEYWRRFKEFYLAEHPNATPRMIQKEFEKLWQKMQEIYIRTRTNDPDGEGTYENLERKLKQIWYEYFGFEEADPFEINPDIMI